MSGAARSRMRAPFGVLHSPFCAFALTDGVDDLGAHALGAHVRRQGDFGDAALHVVDVRLLDEAGEQRALAHARVAGEDDAHVGAHRGPERGGDGCGG